MWRNKAGRSRGRGGFARGKGTHFTRNDGRDRGIRNRDDVRDRNRSGFNDNSQTDRDCDRNYRAQPRSFDVDDSRYERSGAENREDNYVNVRDPYQEFHSENLNIQEEFQDSVDYREQDDRRNVVEDSRRYGEYASGDNDPHYWDDRKPQRQDDLRNRDQEYRSDDYYDGREAFEFTIDTSDRYDGDLRNNLTDFRSSEQHHQGYLQQSEGNDTFRENRTSQHYHSVNYRNQPDQRSNFGRDEHTSHSGRDGRNTSNFRRERFNEKKPMYKANQEKKSYDDKRNSSRSTDRSGGSGRPHDFMRSSSSDRRNKGSKNSETSKSNVSNLTGHDSGSRKRSDSDSQNKVRSGTTRLDGKKSEEKVGKQTKKISVTKNIKTSSKENNTRSVDKKTISKNDQNKQKSNKVSASSKKREDRKQSTSSSRADSSSFKKPGEKHSSRPRSNSGRKVDSDSGHFDDADILSIMADDDGFEKEMKAFISSGERSRSRTRNSRERGSQQNISKSNSSMEKTNERQPHSRERGSSDRHQHGRDRGSNERHEHSRENNDKSNMKPAFDRHIKVGTSKIGSTQSSKNTSDFRSQGRMDSNNRTRVSTSGNRFRTNLNYDQTHKDNRQGSRLANRSSNNNLVGRSRFSTASKIKDSYLKRKKTFQGISNKRFENRHMSKSFVANSRSDLSKQNTFVKSEVGVTGAILKEDRVTEQTGFSDARNINRVRQGFDGKRENKFNTFSSNSEKVSGNIRGNRFQREGANFGNKDRFTNRPFKARDVAYQRVKQKYFKGGFTQNRNNRDYRGGYKDYGKQKREGNKHWESRSEVNNEIPSDEMQNDGPNSELPLDDQAVELNPQQVIFIPNNDLQSGQPHMVDQFGQIILNPDVGVQHGEEAVPVQYLPQQFHQPDGVPQGEQVVFIPFVNNQGPSDYSGNLPVMYNESSDIPDIDEPNKVKGINKTGKNALPGKRKPLSQKARAKLRKSLELKRKLRMEKEIEKKLLKKLLNNPEISKVVQKSSDGKRKPVIKRISPPSSSYQSNKQYKLVRRENDTKELDDVSEDEAKYDNVSDLEEVSENEDEGNDEYGSRQGKRPVFRKPGQPRINKNYSDNSRDIKVSGTSGDVRRVVDNSSMQQTGRFIQTNEHSTRTNQADSVQKFKKGDLSRRSVYIENPKSNADNVLAQKRTSNSSSYEAHQIKKRRSISPIEITVNNDKFAERSYKNSSNEKEDYLHYDARNRKDERKTNYRHSYSAEENFGDRYERTRNEKNEEYEKGNKNVYKDDKERKNQRPGDKTSFRSSEKSNRDDKYRNERNERNYSRNDEDERRKEVDQRDKGKYFDDKGYRRGEERVESRNQKNENYKEHAHDKFGDTYNEASTRRGDNSWQGRYDRNDRFERRKEKSRESNKEERKNSFTGDKSLPDDRNFSRNNQRHDRDRVDNPDHGAGRNIQGSSFVSNINQSQYQMNQPMQSVNSQPFISAQSSSIPLQGQPVMQFSSSGSSVDYSLPPVQNSPMSMPPFPPPGMGVRPDMSLPPPVMNVVGTPNSVMLQQQPNSVQQFQQQQMPQMNIQQQTVQQQHQQQFQNHQQQFQQQQQQFQQMQTQPQMIHQQTNSNFQTHQPSFQTNIQSNQQMSLQQIQPGQYHHTQSGANMIPVNQNQQPGSMNQGQRGSNQQGIPTSGNFQNYVVTSQQQAVRGVIGTIKPSVDSSTMRRGQHVRTSATKTQVSNPKASSWRQGSRNQSNFSPSGGFDSYGSMEDENEVDDDEYLEMLCSKCDKVFLSGEVMRRHGRWHDKVESNTKSYRCDQCEQGFSSSSAHSEHMATKHSVDSWNCSLCDVTYSTSAGLNRHVRHASHKDMKVKFVCSLCPASFMVLTQLVQHRKENHQYNAGYSGLRKY